MSSPTARLAFSVPPAAEAGFSDVRIDDLPAQPHVAPLSLFSQLHHRLLSDEALAKHLQSGNADALTTLFKRHSPLLFGIARRILRNDAEAEDVLQQIFLDVYRSIQQFDPAKAPFKTWLLLFAYQRIFNCRRSLAAHRFFDTDPFDELLPGLLQATQRTGYSLAETGILVGQVLTRLEPRQRRTIELVYYEGLTAEEVSLRTGETVRVVRHNLYRGLEKLRRSLCEPAPSDPLHAKGRSK
jgi:RNA polymerase sigma-70 factor (ECF subfamily)